MKTNRTLIVGGLIGCGLMGLAASEEKQLGEHQKKTAQKQVEKSAAKTNSSAKMDYPVIGHIEKRDRTITIKSGPNGTVYTVKTANGKILCENASLDQLRAQAPELHEFIKAAVAGLDARIQSSALR